MSTKTKGPFERLTMKSNQKVERDWVAIWTGIIFVVVLAGVIYTAHQMGIQLK